MRRLLVLWLVVLSALALSTGDAHADNCDLRINPQDCANTGWVVGGTAAVLSAGTAVLVSQVLRGRPLTPRDRDECGAELAYLDNVLRGALTELREAVDQRTKLRMEKLEWEVESGTVRIKIAEVRVAIATLKAEAFKTLFETVLGGLFWALTAKALVLTGSVYAIAAGWGIRAWRVSKLYSAVTSHWTELKLAWALRPWANHAPKVLQALRLMEQFATAAAEALEDKAREFDPELRARLAAIEAARAEVDQVWQRREDTYQHCLRAGNLPPGTWHRPKPTYYFDDEGIITGVAY